jgi:spermidine synthase
MTLRPSRVLPALYVASGAAGLMLEVAWARTLGLQMGHTLGATSTVLAAFMGGLAAGSWLGGRVAGRRGASSLLRAFALAEAAVAAAAFALPTLLSLADPWLRLAYADGEGGPGFAVARILVAITTLAVPTAAMGAGYPLLTRAVDLLTPPGGRGRAAGALYAANTCGASAGALLAGYVLLPRLGTRGTTWVAAGLDLLVAALALWLARAWADRRAADGAVPTTHVDAVGDVPAPAFRGPVPAVGLVTTAMLGAVSLGSQVVWTRVLALLVGPTTYAFSALLGLVIAGLAIGATVGARLGRGRPAPWLAVAVLAVAATLLGAMSLVDPLALWVGRTAGGPEDFNALLLRQALVAAALLGPTSLVLGAAFPLALAADGASRNPAAVARLYTANTVGGIAGALLAGFLFVPRVGLQGTLHLAVGAATVWGIWVAVRTSASRTERAAALVLAVAIAALAPVARWTPALLASGPYRFAPSGPAADLEIMLTAGQVLYLREGAAATVAVRRLAGTTSLVIDGKPDASNAGDMLTQKLLGHLPLLLHERPRRVCVIGLGSGVTTGAVLRHPVDSVDVVEIAPEVVEAAAHFAADHHDALDDPRTRLLVTDARSHLRFTRATYDVIISEPSNPWMAGVAALFTTEFMQSVRARLAPGGVFCQWAHTYDMSEADLRSILATVRQVFPDASLWLVGDADLLIVAGVDAPPDLARLVPHWQRPGVADDLRAVGAVRPREVADLFLGGPDAVARLADGAPVQRDDRMALEFSAARSFATRVGRDNVGWLQRGAVPVPPRTTDDWSRRGQMLARAEAWPLAFEALAAAVGGGADDEAALTAFTTAAAAVGRVDEAIRLLRVRSPQAGAAPTRRAALASLQVSRGDVRAALDALAPGPTRDLVLLRAAAGIFADLSDAPTLRAIVTDLRAAAPDHPDTAYFGAVVALLDGDARGAGGLAAAGLARHPSDARLFNLQGVVLASQGRRPEARAAFAASRRLDPRQAGTYVNSARLELEEGQVRAAAGLFAEALAVDPASDAARAGLAELRRGS